MNMAKTAKKQKVSQIIFSNFEKSFCSFDNRISLIIFTHLQSRPPLHRNTLCSSHSRRRLAKLIF